MNQTEKLLLSVDEAAEALGIGRSLLYLMLQRGEIQSLHLGRRRLVPKEAIIAFLNSQAFGEDEEK